MYVCSMMTDKGGERAGVSLLCPPLYVLSPPDCHILLVVITSDDPALW
jgi:hypothetical protein